MIDGSTRSGRSIATIAIFTAAGCGMFMNYHFSRSLGTDDMEKLVLSIFGVSFDVVKLLALSAATFAFSKGYKAKACVMGFVWSMALAYGLLSAFGFAALTRDKLSTTRTDEVRDYKDAIRKARANGKLFEELNTKIDNVKKAKNKDGSSRWEQTAGCLDATVADSKNFCRLYFQDLNTLDKLSNAPKIMSDAEADEQIAAAITTDPQTAFIASMLGASQKKVMYGLTIFLALAVELVSALGVYGFSKSIKRPEKDAAKAQGREKLKLVKSAA